MKKLWIVTELFHPDETATAYIMTNIANKLVEQYDVHVICGPIHSPTASDSDISPAITIHRTNHFDLNKDRIVQRTLRFILISIALSWKLIRRCHRGDKVFITTNPGPLLVFVSRIRRLKGFELTMLVHDIFPENTIPAGILKDNRLLPYKIMKRIFDSSYAKADKIIAIGHDMEFVIREKLSRYKQCPNIAVIPNWADVDLIAPCHKTNANRLVLQYAGNLGRVQGLIELLQLFAEANNPSLLLSIWGSGAIEENIRHYIEQHHLQNIEMRGAFNRREQNKVVGECDLCLVTLADGMYGLGVPSKTYNVMAAEKPILFIGPKDSEIWTMVEKNGIGVCFRPTDHTGILHYLQQLSLEQRSELAEQGRKARALALSKYNKENILEEIAKYV